MLRKTIKRDVDYKKSSMARDDYCYMVSSFFSKHNIEISNKDLYSLVESYSNGDTETITKIFLKIFDKK